MRNAMGSAAETSVEFASDGAMLRGVVHQPVGEPVAALVLVHAFAEEKRCAHRPFVEMARAASQAGIAVLRFDFRGCGDSEGRFEDATLDQWRADLRAALAFARANLGSQRMGLLGLRLGAALAAELAEEEIALACLVLWEPIVEGERYLSLTMRRSALRRRLTVQEGAREERVKAGDDKASVVDFDGYLVLPAMQKQIAALSLLAEPKAYPGPTLILNLSPRAKVAAPLGELASLYVQGEALVVRQEPIWSAVGLVDPTPIIAATMSWLRRALGLGTEGQRGPRLEPLLEREPEPRRGRRAWGTAVG